MSKGMRTGVNSFDNINSISFEIEGGNEQDTSGKQLKGGKPL